MVNKRVKKKGLGLKGLKPYYIISAFIIILLVLLIFLMNRQAQIKNPENSPSVVESGNNRVPENVPEKTIAETPVMPEHPEYPEKKDMGDLVFVIDDVGNSTELLKAFLDIPYPVTFAIMPDRQYTEECAAMITAAGKEYILHQPMEAIGDSDPGASAIYTGMSRTEIREILAHNFSQLPDAKGMNNHMGSKATSDPEVMSIVMEYLSENGLFFLDSYTIAESNSAEKAAEKSVSYLKRNTMFLDNEKDQDSIIEAINEGKKAAGKKGHAVMIGHVVSDELAKAMLELYPTFIEDGFTLKEISEIFLEMNQPE